MERRSGRRESNRSVTVGLEKKIAETRRKEESAPDLTDFMNDMFFGAVEIERKTYEYDLTGGGLSVDDDGFDDSTRSNSARLTQEWLQEAQQIVASSPSRSSNSPGRRLLGSPRFATVPNLDRKEALSRTRSARRYRTVEGMIGDEILSKTGKHNRNKSETFAQNGDDGSPVHKWFSNILKPTNNGTHPPSPDTLPPRQPLSRKSRFQQAAPHHPQPQGIQAHNSRRTFKTTTSVPLSPPRHLVESAHRRTISSSTCSSEKITPAMVVSKGDNSLNGFLIEQRMLFQKFSKGELDANVKVVLSGPSSSNSTSSMVTAICHAWLMGYRQREKDCDGSTVVVPVMNVKRGSMWKHKQAAWLFHHAALDVAALLFIDEVDMENLLVTAKLSILTVGQDVLKTTGEVGSQCAVLTDNYCEDAYDLLQNLVLKKLLLAGILLDTHNLKASTSVSMTRDAEAVQLLLVGSVPNYRYVLFDQLMQDQKSTSFVQALNDNYGKPEDGSGKNMEYRVRERKSISSTSDRETTTVSSSKTNSIDVKVKLATPLLTSPSPTLLQVNAEKEDSRGKNKFFLARWFGFGSK